MKTPSLAPVTALSVLLATLSLAGCPQSPFENSESPEDDAEQDGGSEGDDQNGPLEGEPEGVRFYTVRVVREFEHDANAFTQGLVIDRGVLYEGTGLVADSSLRRVDLSTGAVEQIVLLSTIDDDLFGEGVTVFGDRIIQLTWQNEVGFVFDRDTFQLESRFLYEGIEGWGLTHDGDRLIMSDGTSTIRFLDPGTFQITGLIDVRGGDGKLVTRLNELEFIEGEIYANIWLEDDIVVIDPATGNVTAVIDASGLIQPGEMRTGSAVLNGIAYDARTGQLYLTGKLWPKLFEVELVPAQP